MMTYLEKIFARILQDLQRSRQNLSANQNIWKSPMIFDDPKDSWPGSSMRSSRRTLENLERISQGVVCIFCEIWRGPWVMSIGLCEASGLRGARGGRGLQCSSKDFSCRGPRAPVPDKQLHELKGVKVNLDPWLLFPNMKQKPQARGEKREPTIHMISYMTQAGNQNSTEGGTFDICRNHYLNVLISKHKKLKYLNVKYKMAFVSPIWLYNIRFDLLRYQGCIFRFVSFFCGNPARLWSSKITEWEVRFT